jgi:hypothetical protein
MWSVDIQVPFYGSGTSYEVVAFPEDPSLYPVTIAHLPMSADEGSVQVIIPEEDEFDGEIFVFEFYAGSWQEAREEADELNNPVTLSA